MCESRIYLEEARYIAQRFNIHPRTVLRAVLQRENVYCGEGHNPDLNLEDVMEVFSITKADLYAVLYQGDDALTTAETAKFLGCHFRTIRKRNIEPILRKGIIVRYSRRQLEEYEAKR